jgi:hypothetical protein
LSLRGADVPRHGDLVDKRLVGLHVEQDSGTAAMLGEDHGTLGLLDLLEHSRRVGAELGDRANVF